MQASRRILFTSLVAASIAATPLHAADRAAGQAGKAQDSSRSAGPEAKIYDAKSLPRVKLDAGAKPVATSTAEAAMKAFTLVGRTRDGKEVRKVPDETVIRAILGEKTAGSQGGPIDIQDDPALAEGGASREVVGKDNRVRVTDTEEYPYSAVGYLQMMDPNTDDDWYACTAVLIGPKIALTGAECLYSQEQNGNWRENFTFFPGLNGNDKAPYGSFEYETAYVFQGWITEYDGTFASVSPYDIGLVTFSDSIGDSTGWLGYWNVDDDADKLKANVVAYQSDKKPENTMWRSTCNIGKGDIYENVFINDCDVGDNVAPMFVYDKKEDQRYVIGLHIGTNSEGKNIATRLYGAIYDWIESVE